MTLLTVFLIGLALILAHSVVATFRTLIHIGMVKGLVRSAVEKGQGRAAKTKTAQPDKSLVQKDPSTLFAEAFLNGYLEEQARIAQTGRFGAPAQPEYTRAANHLRKR